MDEEGPKQRKPAGRHDEEFKRSVVEHWKSSGKSAVQVAREFGVNVWNLRDWQHRYGPAPKGADDPVPEMEAFWSTLKREALEQSATWSKDRVRREIFEFIEATYNRKRLHSSLGYKSPVNFDQQNSQRSEKPIEGGP